MSAYGALSRGRDGRVPGRGKGRHAGFDLPGLDHNAARASKLLKALSNEHRLRILCHLVDGEKSVGELEAVDSLSQSALSQHLARLRHEGLVSTRREAQMIYYSLADDTVIEIIEVLYNAYCVPGAKHGRNPPAA